MSSEYTEGWSFVAMNAHSLTDWLAGALSEGNSHCCGEFVIFASASRLDFLMTLMGPPRTPRVVKAVWWPFKTCLGCIL